jgi:hypothetical protein
MIKVILISDYAQSRIQTANNWVVNSSFEHLINLVSTDGKIISIHDQSVPINPLSVSVDCFETFKSKPVYESLNFKNTEVIATKMVSRAQNDLDIGKRIAHLESFLDLIEPKEKSLSHFSTNLSIHGKKIVYQADLDFVESFLSTKLQNVEDVWTLPAAIGLGIGLTPSTDDFILGMLCAFDYYGVPDAQFRLNIRDNLPNTTLISAAFLSAGLNSHYSTSLLNMIQNFSCSTIEKVSSVGFSSGLDTISGVLFALKFMKAIS